MYFLSLSVTLLVIIASVHLLAKVRNENLGILSKLLGYFVLLTAVLILACQLYRGVDKMERGDKNVKKNVARK
jgi:tellurite resistance protein TehA-like permease